MQQGRAWLPGQNSTHQLSVLEISALKDCQGRELQQPGIYTDTHDVSKLVIETETALQDGHGPA